MFRNGGAVNAGPAGIMASSPSLIDAVTRDAMNPQGGQTLSMADGGIVRMQTGGSVSMAMPPAKGTPAALWQAVLQQLGTRGRNSADNLVLSI